MNNYSAVGNLGKEIELKYTQSGKAVTSFDLAVRRDKDNTDWIPCVAWEKTAELLAEHTTKGSKIGIEGRLNTRIYENKDGNKVKVVEVVVGRLHFLESKKDKPQSQNKDPFENSDKVIDISDDDLPF